MKERKFHWERPMVVLWYALAVAALVPVTLYSVRLYYFHKITSTFSREKDPEMYVTPKARELNFDEKDFPYTSVYSNLGVRVTAPWTAGKERRNEELKAVFIEFPGEKGLSIMSPDVNAAGFKGMIRDKPETEAAWNKWYGPDSVKTPFQFRRTVLSATPDQFKWQMKSDEMAELSILLVMKAVLMPSARGEIYTFHTDRIEGFQFGDPEPKKMVTLEFYERGKRESNGYTLMVRGGT